MVYIYSWNQRRGTVVYCNFFLFLSYVAFCTLNFKLAADSSTCSGYRVSRNPIKIRYIYSFVYGPYPPINYSGVFVSV